jgi:hypothetical protein
MGALSDTNEERSFLRTSRHRSEISVRPPWTRELEGTHREHAMRILLRTLVGVCIVLTVAAVSSTPIPRPWGRLDLHWVVLPPGLYSLQLEPGACMYFDRDLQALGDDQHEPMSEGCREATPTTTLVLVERGRQRDVELSLSAFRPETTGGGAEGY